MYNNLIEEDIMILDNEFFKIDTMFETVDRIYDIKQRELEYNYIYTESINEEYVDLYTEAEEAKSKNEQGLLGRLFTAILNFIRKIRAKILRLFGNDKKAAELEAKIKGNPKLANQIVEITNTSDAEKAVDEGVSFFGSLIDKVVKGIATEKDANEAEEKGKTLLGRIGIFGGATLLAAGGVKVANDELKKRDKPTIQESLRNLFKKEQAIKNKAENVTKETEEIAKKGEDALKNNSQNSNEENTKAGRGILGSFKNFITGASSLFTGTISEIRSIFNSSSSSNDEEERDFNHECKLNINLIKKYNEDGRELTEDEQKQVNKIKDKIKNKKCTENDVEILNKIIDTVSHRPKSDTQKNKKNETEEHREQKEQPKASTTEQKNDEKKDSVKDEQEKQIQPKTNTSESSKTQKTNDKQQTLTSQERPKNTNTQQASTPQKQEKDSVKDDEETQSNTKKNNKVREKTPQEKMDEEIENLMFKFHDYVYSHERPSVLLLNKLRIKKGYSIVSLEDLSKINFSVSHESKESHRIVERAKIFLDSYNIYSEYKNPDKNKVKEVLKNLYDNDYNDNFLDEEMNGIKITFTTLDKYAKELNELIKKRETFKESSYDLINDILTIFENSF